MTGSLTVFALSLQCGYNYVHFYTWIRKLKLIQGHTPNKSQNQNLNLVFEYFFTLIDDGYLVIYIHGYISTFMFAQLAFIIKILEYIAI